MAIFFGSAKELLLFLLSKSSSAPCWLKKIFTQNSLSEEGVQETGCLCQGGKGQPTTVRQRGLHRALRGGVFPGRKFSAQGLVSFPAQELVDLVGQGQSWLWFQGQTGFLSVAPFSLWLYFRGQNVFLSLVLVPGPKRVSLALISGSRCISLVLHSGLKCFSHWLRFQH